VSYFYVLDDRFCSLRLFSAWFFEFCSVLFVKFCWNTIWNRV